ncbi:MAG TPA: kelch repeat-containing protein, partial [Terriglobales bacterium]|nr:kelch repeat-containing protein [Terriglobales bacterium]
MPSLHDGGCAVVLQDGRILIGGGSDASGATAKVDIFNTDGSWSAAPAMLSPRTHQACAALQDGQVLVAGGITTGGGVTNSAELFDLSANSWSQLPAMSEARAGATSSVLQDGRVLLAGGQSTTGPSNSLEIFDPNTQTFNFAGTMSASRQDAAAVLLQDGRVLIVGGSGVDANGNPVILGSSDIYDPGTGSVSPGPALVTARSKHSATMQLDGKVAVIGGNDGSNDLASIEVYDPIAGGNFSSLSASLLTPRSGHLAFLLPKNNEVLVVGGQSGGVDMASAELYVPWGSQGAGADQSTGSMAAARSQASGAPLSTTDGLLLVAGGSAQTSAELYSFATVTTDQSDYPPGTPVTITGGGWQPGETVTLTLVESPLIDTHPVMSAVADQNGNIFNNQFSPDSHDVNVRFYLTATGSQAQAQNTFTDAAGDNTSTVVVCSPASLTVGSSTTCTATVSNTQSGAPNGYPQGVVTFSFNGTGSFTPASGTCTVAQVGSTNNSNCIVTLTPNATGNGLNVKGNYNASNNSWKNSVSSNFGLTVVAAPIASLAASPSTITSGHSATLTPTFSGGTGSIDHGIGAVTSGVGVSISPTATTTYTLTVTNTLGATATSQVVVTVVAPPSIMSFVASPSTINSGSSSMLTGVFAGGTGSVDQGVGAVTSGVGASVSPTSTTLYTLTVTNAAGNTATATAKVTVNTVVPTTTAFVSGSGQTTTYGSAVPNPLVAQVSASGSTPTGTASLSIDGGSVVDTETLDGSGRATFAGSFASALTAGGHSLHVAYTPTSGSIFVASSSSPDGSVTITQASPVVNWAAPGDIVYGTALTPTQLNATASVPGAFAYSPAAGTVLNAGNAQQLSVNFTPTDTANYASAVKSVAINVNKANATVAANGYTGVYDGNAHGGSGTASGINNEDLSSLLHFTAGFTDVPGGTVNWTFDGNNNYNSASGSVQIVISQAQATVKVTGYSGVYDGNAHGATGAATGVKGEDLGSMLNVGASFTEVPGGTANWAFAGNTDYKAANGNVAITITQADANIKVNGYTGVYDGNAHGASGSATGVKGEDLSTLLNLGSNFTDVPGGTANWTFAGNTNYKSSSGSVAITISQADANIHVTGYTGAYDGNAHGASGTATGVKSENLNGLLTLGATFTDVPGGTANWTFAGNTNYKAANGSAAVTISQADANIKVNGYTGVYDGNPHGATGTATGVKGEDLSSLLNLGASLTDVPGGTANWAFAGNINYKSASGSAAIAI